MHAFHVGIGIAAVLVALGGVLGLVGIRNPRREVCCEECAGGQLRGRAARAAPHARPGAERHARAGGHGTLTPISSAVCSRGCRARTR